ncbi:PilN domain-containing protein [uncultured Succiniclasticum sp.]|uniref:PilN domain-containing protein n=1 Tax=uncultured Succiniclasticum sp. TaxID=1500547 RepID=UPI0025FA8B5B|nr:PilN domain-containing protein [uncultured Succiniclasticum sp.]
MKIIKHFNDILFGELVTLMITGDSVTICQGKNSVKYEFPKTFQDYNYLNHTEEMAGWLLAILQEEKIRIRRCRIVLDFGQVYLQTVKLPVMTAQEQQNWVRWEGSQYVPFEPGTYYAVLTTAPDWKDYGVAQEHRVSVAADFSAPWQATEEAALQNFLLVAIPLDRIETLQQLAVFLRAKLECVTVMEPEQDALPVNLLPVASEKEVIVKRGYQTATVVCLLLSVALAVRGGIIWQRTRNAWLEAERQLAPYQSVKSAYANSKKAEYQIRQYREKLQRISQTEPIWTPVLRAIGSTIPEGCWLEELQQKHTPAGCLELKGCAIKLARVSEFLENLEQSGLFSKVRLVDSGTKRMVLNSRGDNSKQVVSFVLLVELASERKEARP